LAPFPLLFRKQLAENHSEEKRALPKSIIKGPYIFLKIFDFEFLSSSKPSACTCFAETGFINSKQLKFNIYSFSITIGTACAKHLWLKMKARDLK